jgi:hypothetical protein
LEVTILAVDSLKNLLEMLELPLEAAATPCEPAAHDYENYGGAKEGEGWLLGVYQCFVFFSPCHHKKILSGMIF